MTQTIRFRTSALREAFPTGVASARQLVSFGIPERTVYYRCLEGGPWTRLLPGVILLSTGPPSDDQRVLAALLLAGPDAIVTGLEACHRHGLRRGPARTRGPRDQLRPVHLLLPKNRQVRSVGFVHVERTVRLTHRVIRDGVPLTPGVRSCIDAVRTLRSAGEITELLSDAVQRGLCTVAELSAELESGSRRGTAMPRAILREVASGVRSAAERDAKVLWKKSGLPKAMWNARVFDEHARFLGIADCWVDEVAMAWEVESNEWHLSPEHHDYTVERAARFTAAGAVYIATKPKRLRSDPQGVAERLRAVYEQAAARPRPRLRAEPSA